MTLTKKDIFLGVLVPLVAAGIGLIAMYAPDPAQARLKLERAFVPENVGTNWFGKWLLEKVSGTEAVENFGNIDHKTMDCGSCDTILNEELFYNELLKKGESYIYWSIDNDALVKYIESALSAGLITNYDGSPYKYKGENSLEGYLVPYQIRDYLNTANFPPIKLRMVFRNIGELPAAIHGFIAIPVLMLGGGAGAGSGGALTVENEEETLDVSYDTLDEVEFDQPIVIEKQGSRMLEIGLVVTDAHMGDGEGDLSFAIKVKFHNGERLQTETMGVYAIGDSVGFSNH